MPQVKIILEPIALTCLDVGLITSELDVFADESTSDGISVQSTQM